MDISTYEDKCRSLLGVSYNNLSSIMTNHDVIKDILVRIVHNGQACGAGDASVPSDDVQRTVRQVAVSFYVRDCPSPGHARGCVSFFSPLSLPLSSPLSPSLTIPTKNTPRFDLRRYHASCAELLRDERRRPILEGNLSPLFLSLHPLPPLNKPIITFTYLCVAGLRFNFWIPLTNQCHLLW